MNTKHTFMPGKTYIPVSGKVFNEEEINNAIKVARDGWWTEGEFSKLFEKDFKKYLGVKFVSLVNSGSSANLVALYSLTSSIFGNRALKAGDEFITTSVAFPTTVNPGVMLGMKPIFIDAELNTLNIDAEKIEKAITKKTKLIMIAHTLGRPFDLNIITQLCKKYNLWLIEDCCDALGSKYDGKMLGSFGDIATYSFYPAHQITMGEGGAIVTNNSLIHRSIRQFRDGFNLKLTDFQAAIGVAQLKKLPGFIEKRKANYKSLYTFFKQYPQYFSLMEENKLNDISYFGFPLIVKSDAPFTRNELTEYLEKNKIGTRNIFSGNLLRHPAYSQLKNKIKIVGAHKNADIVMNSAFWLGVWSGITQDMMEYVKETIIKFID
ncbi:MAG: DegT/DnrJ/EryC1/StrS family aminotransferase [Candidatus Roizmanbacteria bacterium]|nr:DegT/DnrJ/EryC1/StrS family aminotransferase [Candidatus Roizmanbacteria bacterium]